MEEAGDFRGRYQTGLDWRICGWRDRPDFDETNKFGMRSLVGSLEVLTGHLFFNWMSLGFSVHGNGYM